jgi:hypothetical protein
MNSNIGSADRLIRIVLGLGLIVFAVLGHGLIRWVGAAGVVLVVSALVKFCPAYWVMRIRTIGSPSGNAR